MSDRLIRWLTQDFVFTAPQAFPHVVALETQRFILQPSPDGSGQPSLFVLVRAQSQPWSLDDCFPAIAADLVGADSVTGWPMTTVQLFGREGRYAKGPLGKKADHEVAGLAIVEGRASRLWAFGWHSPARDEEKTQEAFHALMQGLQARVGETGEKILLSQFHRQGKKPHSAVASDASASAINHPAASETWDLRFAAALGASRTSDVAPYFAPAVALQEHPYGEPAPLGASRIGGGPDLQPGTWPSDARGLRHPFLLQIDLADVTSACGRTGLLPDDGLLSFFVHDDSLIIDVVYTPAGTPLVRHAVTEALIEASSAAVDIAAQIGPETPVGRLPHTEGDRASAELLADGSLRFYHTSDPDWALGEPGSLFEALSDERWASAASARLQPRPTRTFDLHAAESDLEETRIGSSDELIETYEDFGLAEAGRYAGAGHPQVHQMLGTATIEGGRDCRVEAARDARSRDWHDLDDPDSWTVLVRVVAGSATGREFWDRDDLVIMVPKTDLPMKRFDRCLLLSG